MRSRTGKRENRKSVDEAVFTKEFQKKKESEDALK